MFSSLYWARLGKYAGHRQGAIALVTPSNPKSQLAPQKYSLVEEGEEISQNH